MTSTDSGGWRLAAQAATEEGLADLVAGRMDAAKAAFGRSRALWDEHEPAVPAAEGSTRQVVLASRDALFPIASDHLMPARVVLDIGCGIRPQTLLRPELHICAEPFGQYLDRLKEIAAASPDRRWAFLQATWAEALELLPPRSVDTVCLLDIIEHLEKEESLRLLKATARVARQQVVVFTTLGYIAQHHPEGKDAWGMDGVDWQEHRSGWDPADFGPGWKVIVGPDFIQVDNLGRPYESPKGAIWAIHYVGSDPTAVRAEAPASPAFSILVPTFNQDAYLPAALDSLRGQTFQDWEAVVVDDGSTDQTARVLADYAALDARIRPFHQPNGGVGSALNEALRQARGEWICWLSSDDLLEPDALQAFRLEMQAHPEAAFLHSDFHELVHETGFLRRGPEGRSRNLPTPPLQTLQFFMGNYIHGISICVRKSLFDRAGFFKPELRYAQDMDMWLRLSALAPHHFLDRRTCVTRIHEGQDTRGFPQGGLLDSARACLDFLNEHPFEALFPRLDLSRGDDITQAVQAALRAALEPASAMYFGVGFVPALLERLGEWLQDRCPAAYRVPIREGLRALEPRLHTLPAGLREPIRRAAQGLPVLYTVRDALDLMEGRRRALLAAGDTASAALLKRYLDRAFGIEPTPEPVQSEAFLLEPGSPAETWLAPLVAYLDTFAPGEPVCLHLLLDPDREGAPSETEVQDAVLEVVRATGREAFADVIVVPRPAELLATLRNYPILHWLPFRAEAGFDTPARRRLSQRLAL